MMSHGATGVPPSLPGRARPLASANAPLAGRCAAAPSLLFAACSLFLWMFLAAEALERLADAGRISGPQGLDAKVLAYRFAAAWRHGMAGGSLIYMPGFFATAIGTWYWWPGRRARRRLAEGLGILSSSLVVATVLAPLGTACVVDAFERQTGLRCEGVPPGPTLVGSALGLFTLVTWSTFVVAAQRAIRSRSFRPFWLPLLLNVVLATVRPVTAGDFTSVWAQRVLEGDGVAIFSFVLIPGAAALLVRHRPRPV